MLNDNFKELILSLYKCFLIITSRWWLPSKEEILRSIRPTGFSHYWPIKPGVPCAESPKLSSQSQQTFHPLTYWVDTTEWWGNFVRVYVTLGGANRRRTQKELGEHIFPVGELKPQYILSPLSCALYFHWMTSLVGKLYNVRAG